MSQRHQTLVFRGAHMGSFNRDEWVDNNADGRPIRIAFASMERLSELAPLPSPRELKDLRLTDLAEWRARDLILREETQWVTGGFTSSLGTAIRFAHRVLKDVTDVPMVMVFDRSKIPTDLINVVYDREFRDEHPFIAGFVDRGSNMLVLERENGRIAGWYDVADVDDEWAEFPEQVNLHQNPVKRFGRMTDEEEVVAKAESIKLDAAIVGVAAYLNESNMAKVLAQEVGVIDTQEAIREASDGRLSHVDASNEQRKRANQIPLDERLELVYPAIQQAMRGMQDDLVVVAVEGTPGARSVDFIDESQFKAMYDGEKVVTDYDAARPYTDARGFVP